MALRGLGMVVGVLSALWVMAPGSASAGGMRCGKKLVSVGDSLYDVRAVCGAPSATDRRVEYRTIRRRVRAPCFKERDPHTGKSRLVCEREESHTVEVVLDIWTYDFGKRRLIHHAHFEQGQLVNVTTGGYGHQEPEEGEE